MEEGGGEISKNVHACYDICLWIIRDKIIELKFEIYMM